MELDDLRRQWQRPEPAAATPLTPAALAALLARQRGGLVDKMRRNARWEMALAAVMAAGLVVALPLVRQALFRLYGGFSLLLMLGLLYYYYRLLGVLRQLAETSGSVRGHLVRLCGGLRQLLRFNYRLTLATWPTILLLIYGFFVGRLLGQAGPVRGQALALTGGILLVFGVVVQVGVVYFTRWYLQRLYGQHLDRLEGQLRELDDSPAPNSAPAA